MLKKIRGWLSRVLIGTLDETPVDNCGDVFDLGILDADKVIREHQYTYFKDFTIPNYFNDIAEAGAVNPWGCETREENLWEKVPVKYEAPSYKLSATPNTKWIPDPAVQEAIVQKANEACMNELIYGNAYSQFRGIFK